MYIKFLDSNKPVECSVIPNGNIVTLKFKNDLSINVTGFHCYLDQDCLYDISGCSYEGFTTLYRSDDETAKYNGYQLSNDDSVYVPPTPLIRLRSGIGGTLQGDLEQSVKDYSELDLPDILPDDNYEFVHWDPDLPKNGEIMSSTTHTAIFEYIPTLDDVITAKISEIHATQQAVIQAGIDVMLTDGSTEHFTLTDHDQTSLMGLQQQVIQGNEQIPWHTSDQTTHCKYYSNADMLLIVTAAMQFVTFHVTYFRDLRIYVNAMMDKKMVDDITYGVYIPEEYQSEVLRDLYAAMEV